jgi:predicted Fe-Mo cluster-binding NifX family protein
MADAKAQRRVGGRRIAVPVEGGMVAEHFGHCEAFAIFETDPGESRIAKVDTVPAPPHQPGLMPGWLGTLGVNVIIAGGMGRRAQDLFRSGGIEVVVGASGCAARDVAQSYLDATLSSGPNPCDH